MAKLAVTALSICLGLLFIFVGLIKLTPAIHEGLHKEMKAQFKEYRSVFPLFKQTGWRLKTSEYRKAVGTLELICGLILAFIPGKIKTFANVLLMGIMCGAIYSHVAIGHDATKMTGALVFLLLLTCRMMISAQQPREEPVDKHRD